MVFLKLPLNVEKKSYGNYLYRMHVLKGNILKIKMSLKKILFWVFFIFVDVFVCLKKSNNKMLKLK